MKTVTAIDNYISGFPDATQSLLQQLRNSIKEAIPEAEETISYGIPTYKLYGNVVHFAAYSNHIGFYPAPSGIETFKKELAIYKSAKGSVQFPLDQPLPLTLIKAISVFRANENKEKTALKKSLRTCKNGHRYSKSIDCPVCPVCEFERKSQDDFLSLFSAPARRALEHHSIVSAIELATYTEAEVMAFHGIGKSSLPKLKEALSVAGLHFKPSL